MMSVYYYCCVERSTQKAKYGLQVSPQKVSLRKYFQFNAIFLDKEFFRVEIFSNHRYSQVCNNRRVNPSTYYFLVPHYKSLYLVKKVLIVCQVLKKKVPTYVYWGTTIIADLRVITTIKLNYPIIV